MSSIGEGRSRKTGGAKDPVRDRKRGSWKEKWRYRFSIEKCRSGEKEINYNIQKTYFKLQNPVKKGKRDNHSSSAQAR